MAKDQINGYQCPTCGAVTVTIDVDDGATPMMLRCRKTPGCEGVAQSMWKRAPLEQVQLANGVTLHAWARPNGWHRVDRRDLCSWNCRLAHDSNVQVNR
jgi:hypothetical protein